MNVFNNIFENIIKIDLGRNNKGTAIWARGDKFYPVSIQVGGQDDPMNDFKRSNDFITCSNGIYAENYINQLVENNTFDDMRQWAGFVYNCPAMIMTYKENHITNSANGFSFNNIRNAVNSSVIDNQISLINTTPNHTGIGIRVNNSLPSTCALNISGNSIENALYGIYAHQSNKIKIQNQNTIEFNLGSFNVTKEHIGIWLQKCNGARILNNIVTKNSATIAGQRKYVRGISIEGCVSNSIFENSLTRMGTGIRTLFNCQFTQLKCNFMTSCYLGVHLDNATMSHQGAPNNASDNAWNNNTWYRVFGNVSNPFSWYFQTSQPIFFPFPFLTNSVVFIPTNGAGCSSFIVGGGGPGDDRDANLGPAVADTSNYTQFVTENKYYEKVTAYQVLKDDPDLLTLGLPTDPQFQSFYTDMEQGNIGLLDAAREATLNEDYQLAWQKLLSVVDTNVFETNMKTVNETYLQFLESGADTLNNQQRTVLEGIAYLPSITNGDAVFMARGILGLMEDVNNESPGYSVLPGFDHSINVNNGTLTLTDTSYSECNITGYLWDFYPSGDTSTQVNPVFTYDTAGVYTVCQTVISTCIDGHSYMSGICEDILLPEKCYVNADFIRNDVVNSCAISLSNQSTYTGPGITYQWFFGDGTSYTGVNPPTHYYLLNGNYNVCLVASVSGTLNGYQYDCSDTICEISSITGCVQNPQDSSCVANAEFVTEIVNCAVYVTDLTTYLGNIISWTWDFGDGTTVFGQYPPPHLYTQGGNYNICLTIEIFNPETEEYCTDQYCTEIEVGCEPDHCQSYPYFTYEIDNCLATFTNWSLSNGYIISWHWDFDDPGSSSNISNAANPFHQYGSPGWYNPCLTVFTYLNGDICEESYCLEIEIRDECNPCEFECSVEYYIEGCKLYTFASADPNYINVVWEFGDGTSGTGINSVHTYTQPGNYIFCMNVLYDNGIEPPCICEQCFEITIEDCNSESCELSLEFDSQIIENCVVNFTDLSITGANTSILSWYWSFGDGYYSYNQSPQHTYNVSGTYRVCMKIIAWTGEEYCYYELCREINLDGCIYTRQTSALIPYHQANEIKIFPNPNDGNFTIEFEVITQGLIQINLLNVLGQIVVKQNHDSSEGINVAKFNAGNLPKGVYFLKIDDGYRSRITRVILQ